MEGDTNKHRVNSIKATIHCSHQNLSRVQRLGVASCIEKSLEEILPFLDRKFDKRLVRIDSLSVEVTVQNKQLPNLGQLISVVLKDVIHDIEENQARQDDIGKQEFKNFSPDEVFFHFLQYGEMPWFAAQLQWGKIDLGSQAFITELRKLLKASAIVRKRLISQFEVYQLQELLPMLYPQQIINVLFRFTALVMENSKTYSERFASGFRLQQTILSAFLNYAQHAGNDLDIEDFFQHYGPSFAVETEKECNGKHEAFLNFLRRELKLYLDIEFPKTKNEFSRSEPDNGITSPNKEGSYPNEIKLSKEIWKEEKSENHQMVANAGIVLLHPFLTRFFNKVGLLQNNEFISIDHQQRGICLLHHLATGELTFPEEKLWFAKHLCNYPIQRPIHKELPISDFELEEIAIVLDSALQHWAALKRTRKEGLRVNFLQRKGLLEKDAMGHTLHVEGHAADVLLDQLPWGLSTVHLPWLPDLLTIKWR